jgi:hypothetical protein
MLELYSSLDKTVNEIFNRIALRFGAAFSHLAIEPRQSFDGVFGTSAPSLLAASALEDGGKAHINAISKKYLYDLYKSHIVAQT